MSVQKKIFKGIALGALTAGLLLVPLGCGKVMPPRDVKVGGVAYAVSTTDFVVTLSDFDDYEGLKQLEHLKTLDISALDLTTEQYDAIAAKVDDDVSILWNVPVGEKKFLNTETELTLSPDELTALQNNRKYFRRIDSVTLDGSCKLTEDLAAAAQDLRSDFPDLSLTLQSKVYGVKADSSMDKLTLDNIAISDLNQLKLAMQVFPNIKTYEMCYCGLSNDVMGGLREEYPDVNFVWVVVCGRFQVRTDAQIFSTWEYEKAPQYNEKTFSPIFKYCTELRALDVGHHSIADLSELTNLKKLQVLDLTDNLVTDISPLAELEDLRYLVFPYNKVKDLSPLENNKNLEDLCIINNNRIKNASVVTKLPNLKRLYISYCKISDEEMEVIVNGIPKDCELQNKYYDLNVGSGWRWNERVTALREAFGHWKKVKEFHSWDDVVYY